MNQIQNTYSVLSNEKLCPAFYRMCIDAPDMLQQVHPGQFIHIRVQDSLQPFFRRPFSVYRAKYSIEIFYEAVGLGTTLLAQKVQGDQLDILGPLGHGFTMPEKTIKQVVMIAGGIGVAPFLALSDALQTKDVELILLYGGRSERHVYEMQEFKNNGVKIYIATDDGSFGVHGRVSELFKYIKLDPSSTKIYTCGPNPMMAAVQKFAAEHSLKGEVACEEIMACALGACLGCSIPTTNGYRTVCYDGPVFALDEVQFTLMH